MSSTPLNFNPVQYPRVRGLPNGRLVRLDDDIAYRGRLWWRTRRGLISDGASIPRIIWPIIGGPFEGRYRRGALFHDDYYRRLARSSSLWRAIVSKRRAVVDHMLFEVAVADGTSPCVAMVIWFGVRLGGGWAWRGHAKRRAAAQVATIPRATMPH